MNPVDSRAVVGPGPRPSPTCDDRRAHGVRDDLGSVGTLADHPETPRSVPGQQDTVLEERTRMAREIHDVLAGSLGVLGIQLQVLRTVLADLGDVDCALELLTELERTAQEGLSETHRAVLSLRTNRQPLGAELATLVNRHHIGHHTQVTLSIEDEPDQLPPETSTALLRVAGEALMNAAKHAPCQPVTVSLRRRMGEVLLSVENPIGHGAPDRHYRSMDGGYGLLGMRERLVPLEGSVTAGTHKGRWVVTARVPG